MSQTEKSINQHLRVLQRSLSIYMERTEVRGELWMDEEFSPEDFVREARFKCRRAEAALGREWTPATNEEVLDSMLDAINYCVFAVRRLTGAVPDDAEG